MPSPMTRMIHSSKFLGLPWAVVLATLASISPVRQLICSTHADVSSPTVTLGSCVLSGKTDRPGLDGLACSSLLRCNRLDQKAKYKLCKKLNLKKGQLAEITSICCAGHGVETDLVLFRQGCNVVLEWVCHPSALHPDI